MRIGIVGGLDRNRSLYESLAHAHGHELVVHTGRMTGRASDGLERLVLSCDVVVIVTEVNSHTAVQVSRRALRRAGRADPILVRKLGPSRLSELLATLDAPARAA